MSRRSASNEAVSSACARGLTGPSASAGAVQFPGWGAGEPAPGTPRELAHLPVPGAMPAAWLASWFPAYGYVLLVLVVLGWLLPGLSFFLDRFRIPVLAPAVFLWAIGFTVSGGDHVFPVVRVAAPLASPGADAEPALARRLLGDGGPVVVVAALEVVPAADVAGIVHLRQLEAIVIGRAATGAGETPGNPLDQCVLIHFEFDDVTQLPPALREK